MQSSSAGQTAEFLVGLTAISNTDVWTLVAVQGAQGPTPTHYVHYNGTNWTKVNPSGLPSGVYPYGFVSHAWGIVEAFGDGFALNDPGYLFHLIHGQLPLTHIPSLGDNILSVTPVSDAEACAVSVKFVANGNNGTLTVLERFHYLNGVWTVA